MAMQALPSRCCAGIQKEGMGRDGTRRTALFCVATGHTPPSCVPPRRMRQYGRVHLYTYHWSRVHVRVRLFETSIEVGCRLNVETGVF